VSFYILLQQEEDLYFNNSEQNSRPGVLSTRVGLKTSLQTKCTSKVGSYCKNSERWYFRGL